MLRDLFKFVFSAVAGLAVLAGVSTIAAAETQVYFGGPDNSKANLTQPASVVTPERNSFLANLSSYGVDDLEDNSAGANPQLSFGATGITAATGFSNGVNSLSLYSVSGNNFLWDTDSVNDWLQFSQPVTAFGSYVVQSGDGASAPPTSTPPNGFTFRLENTVLGTSKDVFVQNLGPDWPSLNVIFVGITDTDPFNRISFVETYDHDGLLWDDLIAGQALAVPEPGSLALLAIGLTTTLAFRARRARAERRS